MSLSYRCRWLGGAVPVKTYSICFYRKRLYHYIEYLSTVSAQFFEIFIGFHCRAGTCPRRCRNYQVCTSLFVCTVCRLRGRRGHVPALQGRCAVLGRLHFCFECGDEQVAGDHAVFCGKAVFEVRGIEELGVRGEFVVALPNDQAQAVFVQKAEFIRRVAVI